MKLTEAVERARELVEIWRASGSDGPLAMFGDAIEAMANALTFRIQYRDGTEMVLGVPEHMTPLDWDLHLSPMKLLGTDGDKLRLSFPKAEVLLKIACLFPDSAMKSAFGEDAE